MQQVAAAQQQEASSLMMLQQKHPLKLQLQLDMLLPRAAAVMQ
jgi:hypothetical protein